MANDGVERVQVEQFLRWYNRAKGANFKVVGKSEQVYPDLEGSLRWDWVCRDDLCGREAAIELTEFVPLRELKALWKPTQEFLETEVRPLALSQLSPGVYHLTVGSKASQRRYLRQPVRAQFADQLATEISGKGNALQAGGSTSISTPWGVCELQRLPAEWERANPKSPDLMFGYFFSFDVPGTKRMIDARRKDEQLGVARSRGIGLTILVVYYHGPILPGHFEQLALAIGQLGLPHTSEVYCQHPLDDSYVPVPRELTPNGAFASTPPRSTR